MEEVRTLILEKKMFQTGDVHIVVERLYRLDSNKAVNRKFRFCANSFCIAVPPANSNLIAPPDRVVIDKSVEIKSDEWPEIGAMR